jgi:MerR family transcriptional regulator, light-induced transcriptional regulator
MNTSSKLPSFNLKVVIQETGIKPHTLRAWERRYGLPQPERTPGGHRLYSQRDIDIVKWLIHRQEEGLTISRAVELWSTLQDKGEDPLNMATYRTEESFTAGETGVELGTVRQKWVEHCLKFDEAAADNVLTQAFALFPVKTVCLEVLQKGLSHMGDLWYENKVTPQQEHFASALAIKRLITLLAAAPEPTRIGRILLASPAKEEHTISLLLLFLLLRHRGWEVVYFGANVPLFRFDSAIDAIKPDLIVMAAQRLPTAATLLETAQFLQGKGMKLAFGGRIFNLIPTLHQRIPGHFLGHDLEGAVSTISQILAFNPATPQAENLPEEYELAASAYLRKRALIETETWQLTQDGEMPHQLMDNTNSRLSEAITAALKLGELEYINVELNYARQLVRNYGLPLDWQCDYFDAYYRAANKHLPDDGRLILNWLRKTRAIYCAS